MINKTKNILFRANSSSQIGIGHIMRDLVLAQKYAKKGYHIIFATQDLKGNINHKILEAGYKLKILKSNSFKELNSLIFKLKIELVVLDSYEIDYKFEKKIKVKTLSFDDTYKKHSCDILLNHNISADKKRYKDLVPKKCKLKCGNKYTLLRDEFLIEKKKSYKPNKKFTIFIAMGGADTASLNIKILKILNNFKDLKVNLVTTTANEKLDKLKQYCRNKHWIKLHVNSTKIARLMKKSNLAIITPSTTVNEVTFMKIPFIAIKTALNQDDMYKFLKQEKKVVLAKFSKKKFINRYLKLKQR